MTYKMKGYSYPGKSPLREGGDPSAGDQSKYQDQPEETTTSADIPNEQTGKTTLEKKAARKAKTKEFLGNLGEQAGKALISAGISAGVNALTRPKKKKTRRSTSNGGFTDINFGRNS